MAQSQQLAWTGSREAARPEPAPREPAPRSQREPASSAEENLTPQRVYAYGVARNRLQFELTESILVSRVDEVVAKMNLLKNYGVAFALDDFGTGYSSLTYLRRLPLDLLKIDRSFVRDIRNDNSDGMIVASTVTLARNYRSTQPILDASNAVIASPCGSANISVVWRVAPSAGMPPGRRPSRDASTRLKSASSRHGPPCRRAWAVREGRADRRKRRVPPSRHQRASRFAHDR